jgi:inorganic pyrophosphatase
LSLNLSAGDDPPNIVNVVIEIPRGSNVKYEIDEETHTVFVDRFLYTSTFYPFNYGFIPHTREADGDPLDALVITQDPVYPMTVMRSRPIGALLTRDEKGPDTKIITVPARRVDPTYANIGSIKQIPDFTRRQIEHFFKHHKELEPNKFVKIAGWRDARLAKKLILRAISSFSK